jgi:hypothetical protein
MKHILEIRYETPIPLGSGFFWKGANRLKPSEWQEIAEQVEKMLDTLQFGSITLVIQDGKVVQIEKNEKVRLQSNKKR